MQHTAEGTQEGENSNISNPAKLVSSPIEEPKEFSHEPPPQRRRRRRPATVMVNPFKVNIAAWAGTCTHNFISIIMFLTAKSITHFHVLLNTCRPSSTDCHVRVVDSGTQGSGTLTL